MTNITQLPTLTTGARASGIVPTTFDDVQRVAKLLSSTQMVPREYQNRMENCAVAILQGLELGMAPLAALQSIAIINGRPCLYGDGALGVVRASGLCEYVNETDDGETATCTIKRKGEPEPIVRTFSMDDAKRAKLAGKSGPWVDYPRRMRQMRARSWALRDGFADVLKGLGIAEEVQDMKDITPRKSSSAAKRDGTDHVFNEINRHIESVADISDMKFLRDQYYSQWSEMPTRWKQLLDDAAALKLQDLGAEPSLIAELLGYPEDTAL